MNIDNRIFEKRYKIIKAIWNIASVYLGIVLLIGLCYKMSWQTLFLCTCIDTFGLFLMDYLGLYISIRKYFRRLHNFLSMIFPRLGGIEWRITFMHRKKQIRIFFTYCQRFFNPDQYIDALVEDRIDNKWQNDFYEIYQYKIRQFVDYITDKIKDGNNENIQYFRRFMTENGLIPIVNHYRIWL